VQESTATQIITYFEGGQADLVVCDGAPDGQLSLIILGFKSSIFKLVMYSNKFCQCDCVLVLLLLKHE